MRRRLQKLRLYRGFPAIPEDTEPLVITEWNKQNKLKRVRTSSFYGATITMLDKYGEKGLKAVNFLEYVEIKFTNDVEKLELLRDAVGIKAVFIYNIPKTLSPFNRGILDALVNHFKFAPDTEFIGYVYDVAIQL